MQQFFADPSWIKSDKIYIQGQDLNHMKNVLRIRPGEEVCVCDGTERKYLCCVASYENSAAVLNIIGISESDTELPSKIYLFQGLPKGDKMELIVQKAVELGVFAVVPFDAKRSVSRLDDKKEEKKNIRWQMIARSAAEQSGRGIIPEVMRRMSFPRALQMAEKLDVVLIPYELEEGMEQTVRVMDKIKPGQSVGIFIGPEGGFDRGEIEMAQKSGAVPISLGKRILRTETAGPATLSILMYHLESAGHKV